MEIRDARPGDAEAIERIRVQGWQAAYRDAFPPAQLDAMTVDASRWRARLEELPAGWSILVAEEGGVVVGFAATGSDRDGAAAAELFALYVDPARWSRGAGRALLEVAEERLGERCDEATLWVLESNGRARRLYERAGWQLDGARRSFDFGAASAPTVRYRKRLSTSRSRA